MTRTSNASNPLRRTSDKKTQITLRHDFRVTCRCALYVAFLETFGEVHSNHKWDQLDICFYSKISILPLSPMHFRRRFLIREKFLFFFEFSHISYRTWVETWKWWCIVQLAKRAKVLLVIRRVIGKTVYDDSLYYLRRRRAVYMDS